jgi:hypothetical protein
MENGLGGSATASPCTSAVAAVTGPPALAAVPGKLACPYGAHKYGGSTGQKLKLTVTNGSGSNVYSILSEPIIIDI